MSAISIDKVIELNKTLESAGVKLHVHDACGGQAFSIEELKNANTLSASAVIKEFFENEGFICKFYDAHNFSIRNK